MGLRLAFDTATAIMATPGRRNNDGVWIPGATSRTTIRVSTQPLSVEEAIQAGRTQVSNERKFFIPPGQGLSRALSPGAGQTAADQIEYDGLTYEVDEVKDWGAYAEVRAVRQNQ